MVTITSNNTEKLCQRVFEQEVEKIKSFYPKELITKKESIEVQNFVTAHIKSKVLNYYNVQKEQVQSMGDVIKKILEQFFNVCEFLGSMFLVIAAVAPMILFVEILNADIVVAVLVDAIAVGFVLFALIEIFGPICTSFFNPVVTMALALNKELSYQNAAKYIII